MKKNVRIVVSIFIGSLLMLGTACSKSDSKGPSKVEVANAGDKKASAAAKVKAKAQKISRAQFSLFKALPSNFNKPGAAPSDALIELGQALYHEKRLSKANDISCNSCHAMDTFGVDNKKTSPGHKGQLGERNSPTSFNAAGHFAQFWDGRAADVEEQAIGPILNAVEMAMPSEAAVVKKLKGIKGYKDAFAKAFPGEKDSGMSYKNIGVAIGAFERQLVTPGRWDKYLKGQDDALSEDELQGAAKFIEYGCQACHAGSLLGGQMYQKVGSVKPWPNQKDQGRFEVTKKESDKMMFKVPSMRNVTETAPYFHDGETADIKTAIKMMGEYQLGREILDVDVDLMVKWFKTLRGEPDAKYMTVPELAQMK